MPEKSQLGELALLIWDLDGTLIDSQADLVASVNLMLAALGRPARSAAEVARFMGLGARVLVQRALGLLPDPATVNGADALAAGLDAEAVALGEHGLELFIGFYNEHKLDRTRPYPGVAAGLKTLREAGFTMAVLTNKPVRPSREIVEQLGLGEWMTAVHGGDSFPRKKPDPMGIEALLAAAGVAADAAAMIGDSAVDVKAGRAAGTWTCGVRYGFAPASLLEHPPDVTVDNFPELVDQLLRLRSALKMAE